MELDSPIYIAGHRGLVGSAIVRFLRSNGYNNLVTRTHQELDLLNQDAVHSFFEANEIQYVIVAAAKVGGILYNNSYQADFLYENLMISANVIHAAHVAKVKKLLFLGSSCIYPKHANQPITETELLMGPLEPTNEGYAIAKIAGLKLCEKYQEQYGDHFISAMPTNLYGPGDNFHPNHSHVIPGLLRRFHEAKLSNSAEVVIWGSGKVKREFLHVDDLAEALWLVFQKYESPQTINVGTGEDLSIRELAEMVAEVVGYEGNIVQDLSKPDGTPRKVLNVDKVKGLGWKPRYSLKKGLQHTYTWALDNEIFNLQKMSKVS